MSSAAGGGGGSRHSHSSSFLQTLSSVGLGYAVGIALGALVLLSTLLLATYVCCRSAAARRRAGNPNPGPGGASPAPGGASPAPGGAVAPPHVIFVAEEDDEDEAAGPSPAQGLDQAAINSYPKFPFSKSSKTAAAGGGGGDAVCPICLCEYREGEMLRVMPDCRHGFHLACVDAWLRLNASCPVCRTSPMPTPLSTPLSELVPLSHFAADRRRR